MIQVIMPAFFATVMLSCDDADTTDNVTLENVVGTYTGTFTSGIIADGNVGTTTVTLNYDRQLIIHCYGEILDTLVVMDGYMNGDSVMLCAVGDEFYNEYGHMMNGGHMMNSRTGDTEWSIHMRGNHHDDDEHFGSFDMQHHAIDLSFRMDDEDLVGMLKFHGYKNP